MALDAWTDFIYPVAGSSTPAILSPQRSGNNLPNAGLRIGIDGKTSTWLCVCCATLGLAGKVYSTKPRTGRASFAQRIQNVLTPRLSTRDRKRTALAMGAGDVSAPYDPTQSLGVMAPVGYWDPCGLMKERVGRHGWQWKDEATFDTYRIMEVKHGRLAMLAVADMLIPTFNDFPGVPVPEGFAAVAQSPEASAGLGLISFMAGCLELMTPKGDYKDPIGLLGGYKDDFARNPGLGNAELAHGRLAMSAALTLLLSDLGGVCPSDVFSFGLIQLSNPFAWFGLFLSLLAWNKENPEGMAMTPVEFDIGLPGAKTIQKKHALRVPKLDMSAVNLPVSDSAIADDAEEKTALSVPDTVSPILEVTNSEAKPVQIKAQLPHKSSEGADDKLEFIVHDSAEEKTKKQDSTMAVELDGLNIWIMEPGWEPRDEKKIKTVEHKAEFSDVTRTEKIMRPVSTSENPLQTSPNGLTRKVKVKVKPPEDSWVKTDIDKAYKASQLQGKGNEMLSVTKTVASTSKKKTDVGGHNGKKEAADIRHMKTVHNIHIRDPGWERREAIEIPQREAFQAF